MPVVVVTGVDDVDATRARLRELGATRTQVTARGELRRLVVATVPDERAAGRIVARLRAGGAIAVNRPDAGGALTAWVQHTRPLVFGDRLGACFAWSEHERPDVGALVEIGPGGWGGGHPSTQLVIDALLERVDGGERVLDVGCGSGILGLCALALGAAHVVAIDLKASAAEATSRNAALNGVADHVEASTCPLDAVPGAFDIVLANVGMAAAVELAPQLVRHLAPDGWLAISGISPHQCDAVAGFVRPLVETRRRTSGEWAALELGTAQGEGSAPSAACS